MKAVIMAGGEGKRLRPLTETMPKPLVPVGNVPAIRRILHLLSEHGITDAAVTTGYLAEKLENTLGNENEGVTLTYFRESEPKGTAGSVKSASDYIGNEDFLVISGDAVCEFDITKAIENKNKSGAEALIILTHVSYPGEYGVVLCDNDGKITGFSEKPSLSGTFSDTVNTGIYILSPSVLSKIPSAKPFDFGRDLFPEMLKNGAMLYGTVDDGYWCDIGDPEAYHDANMKISEGRNVIGPRCEIATRDIKKTVIMADCHIGENCRISESIICENVTIENDCAIGVGCIIGEGSVIGEGAVLTDGTRLSAGSHVPDGMILRSVAICGGITSASALLSDKGIRCRTERLSASLAVKIGCALTDACGKGRIGIMHDGSTFSCRTATAILRGIRAFGGEAVLLGQGFEAAASYAAVDMKLDLSIMLSVIDHFFEMSVFDENGLYPKRDVERRFLTALSSDPPASSSVAPRASECNFTEERYIPMLTSGRIPLESIAINIQRENEPSRMLTRILLTQGAVSRQGGVKLSVSDDGFSLSAEQDGFVLDDWHIKAILLKYLIRGDAALPVSSPAVLFDIGGARVIPYTHCPSGNSEDDARAVSAKIPELRHACAAGAELMGLLVASGRTLRELSGRLPRFATESIDIPFPSGSGHLGILSSLGTPAGDGVKAEYARGSVRIVPNRNGFSLSAEAASGEYASELLSLSRREIERLLKK